MSQTAQLYRLQQIDSEIGQGKTRLAQIKQLMTEPAALLEARKGAQEAAAAHEHWQKAQRDVRETLNAVRLKAKQTEQRLYSGLVKNPKELSDLQLNVQALGRQQAALEDDVLEAMVMIDELAEASQAADRARDDLELEWQATQAALLAEQRKLTKRQGDLSVERQGVIALIEAPLLREYEQQARRQRNHIAVAGLKGNICQVCGVGVSGSTSRAAALGEQAFCDSCGRILHPL